MSKMFLRCAPDNEKIAFGGVPFGANREMLARGVSVCESDREGTGEGEGMFLWPAVLRRLGRAAKIKQSQKLSFATRNIIKNIVFKGLLY